MSFKQKMKTHWTSFEQRMPTNYLLLSSTEFIFLVLMLSLANNLRKKTELTLSHFVSFSLKILAAKETAVKY